MYIKKFSYEEGEVMTSKDILLIMPELGYTYEYISDMTGVPLPTLQKIVCGDIKPTEPDIAAALEAFFKNKVHEIAEKIIRNRFSGFYISQQDDRYKLCEAQTVYKAEAKKSSGYTLEDYLALPDDQRVELIDGVFYDMAAPTGLHQALVGSIHNALLNHVRSNGGSYMPLISPLDVQLDCDDKTVVQPDICIICDRGKYKNGRIFGAPDMVAEVLSPSTRKKDMSLKLYKYLNAGVREYWIIDLKNNMVIVYDLEHDIIPKLYSLNDKVPVMIWDGKCEVDFADIERFVSFMFDDGDDEN